MGTTKISSIKDGDKNVVYDITLPTDADPEIAGLTVTDEIETGSLTVNGSATAKTVIADKLYSENAQAEPKRLLNIDDLVKKNKVYVPWASESTAFTTTLTYTFIGTEQTPYDPLPAIRPYRPYINFGLYNFYGKNIPNWHLSWKITPSQTQRIEVEDLPLYIGTTPSEYKAKAILDITCSLDDASVFIPDFGVDLFTVTGATVYIHIKCKVTYIDIYPTDHAFLGDTSKYTAVKLLDEGTINATATSTVAGNPFVAYHTSSYDNFTLTKLRIKVDMLKDDHATIVDSTNTQALTYGSATTGETEVRSADYVGASYQMQLPSTLYTYYVGILPYSLFKTVE